MKLEAHPGPRGSWIIKDASGAAVAHVYQQPEQDTRHIALCMAASLEFYDACKIDSADLHLVKWSEYGMRVQQIPETIDAQKEDAP
jgi:hypothetical protein